MSKNFDGAAWATNHGNNFQALIAQARRKVKSKIDSTGTNNDKPGPVLDQHITNESLTRSPNCDSAESVHSEDCAYPKEGIDLVVDTQSPENTADLNVGD